MSTSQLIHNISRNKISDSFSFRFENAFTHSPITQVQLPFIGWLLLEDCLDATLYEPSKSTTQMVPLVFRDYVTRYFYISPDVELLNRQDNNLRSNLRPNMKAKRKVTLSIALLRDGQRIEGRLVYLCQDFIIIKPDIENGGDDIVTKRSLSADRSVQQTIHSPII